MSEPDERQPTPLGLIAPLLVLAALFVQMFAIALLQGLGMPPSAGLIGASALIGYGAAFAIVARRLGDEPGRLLGFVSPPSGYRWTVLLLLPAILLVSEIDNIAAVFAPRPEDAPKPSMTFDLFLVLVAVYPMVYEIFFRGLVQPMLVHSLGARWGIVVMAALNGIAMLTPRAALHGFVNALLLGYLRHRSGSIIPCIALAVLQGLVTAGAGVRAFGIGGFDDVSVAHTSPLWLIAAAIPTYFGLRRCRRMRPPPPPPAPEPEEAGKDGG